MTDANVWLALAAERHEHHKHAREWFLSLDEGGAVFCRVTQMAFLRLLTNPAVMREDTLDPTGAWLRYQNLRRDWRVIFASEPTGLEQEWFDLIRTAHSARSWTDAYLAAFAIGHGYTLVTFDRGFGQWSALRLKLLPPSPV